MIDQQHSLFLDKLKNELIQLNTDFIKVFENAETFSGISKNTFDKYEETCNKISKQISEDIVRVAVVGTLKSGKSTFVNSLFRNDYLKRGAGVITSFVTKLHCGKKLMAAISFKSWDEINTDIEQGIPLLPIDASESDNENFDLRKASHRLKLQKALDSLKSEQIIIEDSRNLNIVLLSSYLQGFDSIKDIIKEDSVTKIYKENKFAEHRIYAGDEIMAVFINDIQLEINTDTWSGSIEIADCQGSDSSNPLHLAMVQDHLAITNLIVYVISSRTGLRRADIKFLLMIKEMGIMDNMLFVVNCDLSEHESINEFNVLMNKIKDEIAIIIPDPDMFTISALFTLFNAQKNSNISLSKRDTLRLQQWEIEKEFTELSINESARFENVLNEKLTQNRCSILFKNHIAKLSLIAKGISQRVSVNKEIINQDSSSAKKIINQIKDKQEKTNQISAMLINTLDGAVEKVNTDLKREIDIFFDENSGTAIKGIKRFIENYEYKFEQHINNVESSESVVKSLYVMFQNFKQAIDAHMTEAIMPKIMGFIKTNEKKLIADIYQMTKPYANMIENALEEYSNTLDKLEVHIDISEKNIQSNFPNIESIKNASNIKYPKASTVINYTARVRAESVMKFGMYSAITLIKKTFKKRNKKDKIDNKIKALRGSLSKIKQETSANFVSHFASYKENLKFQYFYKLTDVVANSVFDTHTDSFNAYITDLETVSKLITEKKLDRKKFVQHLELFEKKVTTIIEQISIIKEKIT
jgi:GTPase SAR1 family protein